MIGAKKKYGSVQTAMNTWRDYMVSMGFGYPLGVDLPGEKRGMIRMLLIMIRTIGDHGTD